MRVPASGLTLDEYRIVQEGYRLAESLLRDYRDPPSGLAAIGAWVSDLGRSMIGLARAVSRG